jgi:hypothetical protein
MRCLLLIGIVFWIACSPGPGSDSPFDASPARDAGSGNDAALPTDAPTPQPTCASEHLGTDDGCDCGCNVVDADCPTPLTIGSCEYENCETGFELDPSDPTQCVPTPPIVVPAGWTCAATAYDDGVCNCGCGVNDDKDCPAAPTISSCSANSCPSGMWPDRNNPTACVAAVSGWTCTYKQYYDTSCTCGCGVKDPTCPTDPHITQCTVDGCPSGQSPNPTQPTQCMTNAPQDKWTCSLALLDNGQCDCGCGAIDTDCPANATASSCVNVHCGSQEQLKPGNIGVCWEVCVASTTTVGNATCTNHGSISIFNECNYNVSGCSDGRTYEVECVSGECVCRVNGMCVKHVTGSCSLNFTCGWNIVET